MTSASSSFCVDTVQISLTWITSQTEQEKIPSGYSTLSESLNTEQSLKLLLHCCASEICDLGLCGQTKLALSSRLKDPLCSHITYNHVVIRCRYPFLYPIIPFLCVKG